MSWYCMYGNPRWDNDELWTTMGHLYKGGMWFKKKAYISGFDTNTAVDGTDWRTSGKGHSWSASSTLPDAAEASNYFYLPALGYYVNGKLGSLGYIGYYWSSSAFPWYTTSAYLMNFNAGHVGVYDNGRSLGYRVGTFK